MLTRPLILLFAGLASAFFVLWLKELKSDKDYFYSRENGYDKKITKQEYQKLVEKMNSLQNRIDSMKKASSEESVNKVISKPTDKQDQSKQITIPPENISKTKKKLKSEDIKKMTKEEKLTLIKSIIEGFNWEKFASAVVSMVRSQKNPEDLDLKEISNLLSTWQDLFDLQKLSKDDKDLQDYSSRHTMELFYPEFLDAIGPKLTEGQRERVKQILRNFAFPDSGGFSLGMGATIMTNNLNDVKKTKESFLSLNRNLKQILTDEQFTNYIDFERKNDPSNPFEYEIRTYTKDVGVNSIVDYWLKEYSLPHELKPQIKSIASEFYDQYMAINNYYSSSTDYLTQTEKELKLLDLQLMQEEKIKAIAEYGGIKLERQSSSKQIKITEGQ